MFGDILGQPQIVMFQTEQNQHINTLYMWIIQRFLLLI